MSIPEFTAQASLYRTSNHYRSLGQLGEPQRTIVIPQRGGPGFEGKANCIMDCVDKGGTAKQCEKHCRDPGGTSPVGGYGPSCDNSPPPECGAAGFLACVAAFGPFGCALVWGGLRDTCLENSSRECFIARHGPLRGGSSYPRSGVTGQTHLYL